jgi:hypothetical protein
MSNSSFAALITLLAIAWTLYSFFRFIPESAAGKSKMFKLTQSLSYAVFSFFFLFLITHTELGDEDLLKFEWKFIAVLGVFCTSTLSARWGIELMRKESKENKN